MRIRYYFAGAFIFLLIFSGYMGLLAHNATLPAQLPSNGKVLHLITFFSLSLIFYWIPDTSRRRATHATLLVCTLTLGIGSEVAQSLLPVDRRFDPFNVLANVVGSLGAVGLCSWYHRRMLERRRKARFGALADGSGEDVELGVGTGGEATPGEDISGQETGVRNLEQEVDNWDENAVDNWDTEDGPGPDTDDSVPVSSNLNSGGPPTSTEAGHVATANKRNE